MSDYATGGIIQPSTMPRDREEPRGVMRPSAATPLSLTDCGRDVTEPVTRPDDRLSYDITVRWPDGRPLIAVSATESAPDVAAALREIATTIERVR